MHIKALIQNQTMSKAQPNKKYSNTKTITKKTANTYRFNPAQSRPRYA